MSTNGSNVGVPTVRSEFESHNIFFVVILIISDWAKDQNGFNRWKMLENYSMSWHKRVSGIGWMKLGKRFRKTSIVVLEGNYDSSVCTSWLCSAADHTIYCVKKI